VFTSEAFLAVGLCLFEKLLNRCSYFEGLVSHISRLERFSMRRFSSGALSPFPEKRTELAYSGNMIETFL
jgi:hypothetical protein